MFRELIKYEIKDQGLTAKKLCRKLGIREASLSEYLNNKSQPRVDVIEKILLELGFVISKPGFYESNMSSLINEDYEFIKT